MRFFATLGMTNTDAEQADLNIGPYVQVSFGDILTVLYYEWGGYGKYDRRETKDKQAKGAN
jgi:hypothetical protein